MAEQLIEFFNTYGWSLTGIAVLGIVVLGILKYCNVFSKMEEIDRHYVYLAISIGLSAIGTVIYLVCKNSFDINTFVSVMASIFALNQTMYNIFKVTRLKELFRKILDKIVELFLKK